MKKKPSTEERSQERWDRSFEFARDGDVLGAAFNWRRLAEEGNAAPMVQLGILYEIGCDQVPRDLAVARSWYEKAAAEGVVEAIRSLGRFYFLGLGVTKNYEKSFSYYSMLDAHEDMRALHAIGIMYLNGLGVEKDTSKARDFFYQSTNLGSFLAMKHWGYSEGLLGHKWKGMLIRVKAGFHILVVGLRDVYDDRLRPL